MSTAIAISGMACRFPDAESPVELWRNVLSQRRAFRRIPPERLNLEDYLDEDPAAEDCTYSQTAAVLDGWQFDRVRFKIAGRTFRSTDLAQWLALEVAADAIKDAGWDGHQGLPRERTGVLVGNTLTGEFSRSRLLRLRWPYLKRIVAATLQEEGRSPEAIGLTVARLERRFKAPFAPIDEDTLAGALSNTIAGRVCNAFDLGGGGYTVDGACASSLLAVATACAALRDGDLDVVLAGGIDLSLDPFELVGFAKAGALARTSMRVYDSRSEGFWPGEGCGFVVLERIDRLQERGGRPYALIRGWGISSDGAGGITRPTVDGELRALNRAYARTGIRISEVDMFEGHGTGTAVGDRIELAALDAARRADGATRAAAVGSIKANIGHTKAAAGIAGLIKATLSVHERVIPPNTACGEPHDLLRGRERVLRPAAAAEPWPHAGRARAGISGFGFGGINCHVVLEDPARRRVRGLGREARRLTRSAQDAELMAFSGPDVQSVRTEIDRVRRVADELSLAELGDLAATLHRNLPPGHAESVRAALVASTPEQLASGLDALVARLAAQEPCVDIRESIFLDLTEHPPPRVGVLFPGQASPVYPNGGALARRFEFLNALSGVLPETGENEIDTAVAQPAIVGCELMGLELLRRLSINAAVAVGHSVGELTALHWAGALDSEALIALARARGQAIASHGGNDGAMASLGTDVAEAEALIGDERTVVVAAENGPAQTVISGPVAAIETVVARAAGAHVSATRLSVSHAFHSPLVADAAAGLAEALSEVSFSAPQRPVMSTITGEPVPRDADFRTLLVEQLTAPVRFASALERAVAQSDVLLEVGPGVILAHLAKGATELPALSLDVGGPSLRLPLAAAASLFALGARPRLDTLFLGRFVRPFELDRRRAFLANPCEKTTVDATANLGRAAEARSRVQTPESDAAASGHLTSEQDVHATVRHLVAARTELPEHAVGLESRLLDDLHLTSIAVGELAAEAAKLLGIDVPPPPTELADATIADLGDALEALRVGRGRRRPTVADGVSAWFRTFAVEWIPRRSRTRDPDPCRWTVIAPDDHPLRSEIVDTFAGDAGERAVLVCLPPEPRAAHARLLLQAAQEALRQRATRCAFLHTGDGAGGFAKSFYLEHPEIGVSIIDWGLEPALLPAIRREAESSGRFVEVRYEADRTRLVPILRECSAVRSAPVLGPEDVVLVSGGGKGIGAECALALARTSGAKVALLGRSEADSDERLCGNLARFADARVRLIYVVADVTDGASTESAVERVRREMGEVTAILHAAGINRPALVEDLDADELQRTLAPKLVGLEHLLGATDTDRLRMIVTFGSIIGRTGLRGEAHYALANDWLGRALARLQPRLPGCRCLNVDWTVWSGAGMGERLGTITALAQAGVTPLPVDEGVRILERLACSETPIPSLVVAGRFGPSPTIELEPRELPLLRFLERPLVHYPGVELVAEAKLSHGSDPYLGDHVLEGTTLLPAVLGLEAMASVASALAGREDRPMLEDARFDRPVTVSDDGQRTIQLAGLVAPDGSIRVVLRSEETNFQVDHFALTCRFDRLPGKRDGAGGNANLPELDRGFDADVLSEARSLDPMRDLYGGLLFHGARFQRVLAYRELRTRRCVAEIDARRIDWFGSFLPQTLLLGDPGAHDAIIHAIQPCIPYARLVPVALDRLVIHEPPDGHVTVVANERSSRGDTFVYDITVSDASGGLCECWQGLSLQRVGDAPPRDQWPPALLVPLLERRLEAEKGRETVQIALLHHNGSRRQASDAAIAHALGVPAKVRRRADGRPETASGVAVSTSHLNGYTLAVAGAGPLGCDIESAVPRPEQTWADLLGAARLELARRIDAETGVGLSIAATRVWAATECLKKAGLPISEPLTLGPSTADGWIVLSSGAALIATFVARVPAIKSPVAIALLVRGRVR